MNIDEILGELEMQNKAANAAFLQEVGVFLYQPDGKLKIVPEDNRAFFNEHNKMRIAVYNDWLNIFLSPGLNEDKHPIGLVFETERLEYPVYRASMNSIFEAKRGIIGYDHKLSESHYSVGARSVFVKRETNRDQTLHRVSEFAKKAASALRSATNKSVKSKAEAQLKMQSNQANESKAMFEYNERYGYSNTGPTN